MNAILAVDVETKTWVTLGLVLLAIFEFWTAMYVFGRKGPRAGGPLVLRLHRIGGYVFLLYWIWPIVVGLDLMSELSDKGTGWRMDSRVFYHAMLGVVVALLLVLKILLVRFYTTYRQHARLLGFLIVLIAITTWLIAGWFYLFIMTSPMTGQ